MSDERRLKKDRLEVSSQPLEDELVAIKERLNAIETIQSISNAAVVKKYVEDSLKTQDAKKIMAACGEPKTKDQLQTDFGYKSKQALDYHLQPLKEADLLRREVREDGVIVFAWSNLFRRLPKSTIKSLLGGNKQQRESK
jgi:DNA-binding transcriptional ArsR family regulator